MADHQEPFADVVAVEGGFSIPELKWRELVFVGRARPEGDGFVRDPARPLPPFRREGLFPEGRPLPRRARRRAGRAPPHGRPRGARHPMAGGERGRPDL